MLILLLPPPSLIVPLRQGQPPVRESSHAGQPPTKWPAIAHSLLFICAVCCILSSLSARARDGQRPGEANVKVGSQERWRQAGHCLSFRAQRLRCDGKESSRGEQGQGCLQDLFWAGKQFVNGTGRRRRRRTRGRKMARRRRLAERLNWTGGNGWTLKQREGPDRTGERRRPAKWH